MLELTSSMEHILSWEINSWPASQEISLLINEPNGPLPCSQQSNTKPILHQTSIPKPYMLLPWSIKISSSYLCLGLPNSLFTSGFLSIMSNVFLISLMHSTCHIHFTLVFITWTIHGKTRNYFGTFSQKHIFWEIKHVRVWSWLFTSILCQNCEAILGFPFVPFFPYTVPLFKSSSETLISIDNPQ
jgi:hypothetical protein